MSETRMFPIQSERGAAPHPTCIPWSVAERAYSVYSARYGRDQSLERMAERGGFGPGEMDIYLPGWREEASEVTSLRLALTEAQRGRGEEVRARGLVMVELEARALDAESRLQQVREWWRQKPHWPADCPCEECSPNSWRNTHGVALEAALTEAQREVAAALERGTEAWAAFEKQRDRALAVEAEVERLTAEVANAQTMKTVL